MESLYKKKNFKFSKEIKKEEISKRRDASRQKRLSTFRDISFKDSKENINELHKLGEKKSGIPSRNDMLKKWKEEKAMKQKQPQNVKSVVKPGFCFKKQATTAFKNKTDDSKLKVQNTSYTTRAVSQNTKLVSKSTSTSVKPQVTQKSAYAPKATAQKPKSTVLPSRTNTRLEKTIPKETKPNVQKIPNPIKINSQSLRAVPPLTNVRIASKKASSLAKNAFSLPKSASSLPSISQKLPVAKSKLERDTKKANVISSNKPSKLAFPKCTNSQDNKLLNKRNQFTKENEVKESKVKSSEVFKCDISMIEPSIRRKSFAPQNFMFCPPSEWSFAFPIEVSSSDSFLKLKSNGVQRTSSPLKLEQNEKSSVKELSDAKKDDPSLNCDLHNGTNLNEKENSPSDDKCERSLTSVNTHELNIKAGVSEIEIKKDISVSDFNADVRPKMLFKAINDFKTDYKEDLQENVTHVSGMLNVKPNLLVAFDNGIEELPSKVTEEKVDLNSLLNVEPTALAAFDDNTSQNTFKDCFKSCATSLKETFKQDDTSETVNSFTSKVLDDNKSINFESVDVISSCKPDNCTLQTIMQIKSPSQSSMEDHPHTCVSSSNKTLEQNEFFETLKGATSELDVKLVDIDSIGVKFSGKSIDKNTSENIVEADSYVSDSIKLPLEDKLSETTEIVKDINLVDVNTIDAKFSFKSIHNSTIEKNEDFLIISNNTEQPCKEKPLDKVDMLESINSIKSIDTMSSGNTSENCLNGLIEVENHEELCPSSLSESLKSFSLATSVAERVSKKVSMGHRKSRMTHRYALESINESIESKGTPCVTPSVKKLIAEDSFTPRRSPRLAEKLNRSGSFESILNIEKPEMINSLDSGDIKPKANEADRANSCVKKGLEKDEYFTPRRSQRLLEMLRRSSSLENLFDVKRPSIMGSPCKADFPVRDTADITYDFDNLFLEDSPKFVKSHAVQRSKKVSLLYTPPTRKSTIRQSIRGDLMSFSPS